MTPEYIENLKKSARFLTEKKDTSSSSLASLSASSTGERIIEIDIKNVQADPMQPRKTFNTESIQELADDIKQNGLIQPIIVRADKSKLGMYIVVAGERRLKASSLAGLNKIKAIVNSSYSEDQLGYVQVSENIKRDDLKFYEMAEFIIARVAAGEKQSTVADKLGMSKQKVNNYMVWSTAPEYLKEAKDSFSSIRTFYDLVKLSEEYPEEVQSFIKERDDKALITRSEIATLTKKIENPEDEEVEQKKEGQSEAKFENNDAEQVKQDVSLTSDNFTENTINESSSPEEPIDSSFENSSNNEPTESPSTFNNYEDSEKKTETEISSPEDNQVKDTAFDNTSSEFLTETESKRETSFEASESDIDKKDSFKKPLIIGNVEGREAELMYKQKPSTDGMIVVKYEDSSTDEIAAEHFVINRIFES